LTDVIVAFSAIAAIMILSFIGEVVSRRVLLPSVILLIVLGIICGPALHLFEYDALVAFVPFIAPLTIAFIGFEAGMKMDIYEVMEQSKRAFLLSILGFVFGTVTVGFFLHYFLGVEWSYAFLMASAWGGVSTATVDTVCKHLRLSEKTRTTLIMTSLADDSIVLISTLTILNYILLGEIGIRESILILASNICTSIFIGVLAGLAWINLVYLTRKAEYTYTFILAAILFVYSITEILGGTGGIAIFIFGLMLGNFRSVTSALKLRMNKKELSAVVVQIENFHSQLTFIIRSFFFTFIGLIYVFTGIVELLLGLAVSIVLHLTRFLAVKIGTFRSPLASDLPAIGFIVGKGVASAAMSTLPLAYNLPNASFLASTALNVILFINVISIVLPFLLSKRAPRTTTPTDFL